MLLCVWSIQKLKSDVSEGHKQQCWSSGCLQLAKHPQQLENFLGSISQALAVAAKAKPADRCKMPTYKTICDWFYVMAPSVHQEGDRIMGAKVKIKAKR